MSLHLIDTCVLIIASLVAFYFVMRFDLKGVFIGAISLWIILLIEGYVISALDPKREGALVDTVWLLFGWAGGLLYCFLIYGLKKLYVYFRKKREPAL